MVSVPWVMTMPSYCSQEAATSRAMTCHSSGWILEESSARMSRQSIWQSLRLCMLPATMSDTESSGVRPFSEMSEAMVPPVARMRILCMVITPC